MKILLDECVTKHLKPFLQAHEVKTVSEMKWNGIKNGVLIGKAEEGDFQIIITIDKRMRDQQVLSGRKIAFVIFDSLSSDIEVLKVFIPKFLERLDSFQPGNAYLIS